MPKCEICGSIVGINAYRLGVCWECAEAESIISDGTDMSGKTMEGAHTPRGKLRYLIVKGWVHRCQVLSGAQQPPTGLIRRFAKWLSRHFV